MSLLNKKKIPILIILGVALFGVLIIIGLWLAGPLVGCTLMSCQGGLHINLSGLTSPDYQISISFPSGETQTLSCGPDAAKGSVPFEKSCTSEGAYFRFSQDVTPPIVVTVTVVVDGKTYSQKFSPSYTKFQPNGKRCPPTCYNATIEMKIRR